MQAIKPGIDVVTDDQKKKTSPPPPLPTMEYFERALDLQRQKIESQAAELTRMGNVYKRDVRKTKISEAFKFLINVIHNKIKR